MASSRYLCVIRTILCQTFVILSLLMISRVVSAVDDQCEDIVAAKCQNLQFDKTLLPNSMGQTNQTIINNVLRKIDLFLNKEVCSPHFWTFLCSQMLPVCTGSKQGLAPCREFCMEVETDCPEEFAHIKTIIPSLHDKTICEKLPLDQQDCYTPSAKGGYDAPGKDLVTKDPSKEKPDKGGPTKDTGDIDDIVGLWEDPNHSDATEPATQSSENAAGSTPKKPEESKADEDNAGGGQDDISMNIASFFLLILTSLVLSR